jgi:hypothetical protein
MKRAQIYKAEDGDLVSVFIAMSAAGDLTNPPTSRPPRREA